MKSILITALLFSMNLQAATPAERKTAFEAQTACDNVIQSDDTNLYIGFGTYLAMGEPVHTEYPGRVDIVEISNPKNVRTITTADGVVGLKALGSKLYVLTYTSLEVWDMTSWQKIAQHKTWNSAQLGPREHAKGFYYFDNKFAIAQGKLGISIFDLATEKIIGQIPLDVNQDRPQLSSQAIDIDGIGAMAVLAVDNLSMVDPKEKPAFRGLVVVDLKAMRIVSSIFGIDPGVMGVNVVGDKVMAAFHPAVWKMDLTSVLAQKKLGVEKIAYQFPDRGWGKEKVFFDTENIYMCFRKGIYSQTKFTPHVFKRSDLGL